MSMNTGHVILSQGEIELWSGKPKKSAFIATKSLTMLPLAFVWLLIDFQFIQSSLQNGEAAMIILPFFALHLMPVWIWLANVITASRRWTNTTYYVTNRRIIIQGGFFAVNETSLFYKDLRNTRLNIGFLDKLFHTGDICFDDGYQYDRRHSRNNGLVLGNTGFVFEDMEDASEVYSRIQKIILDIQTDMEYPNALRPDVNPGYTTEYRP